LDLFLGLLGGLGIAIPCGFNPYLPLLVISVAGMGKLTTLNPDIGFLNSWTALIVLAILVGLDIVADKLPQIENLYRWVNLLICPISGGLAMAAIIPSSTVATPASFAIGLIASELMHLVKSGLRPALIGSSKMALAFESMISMAEDMLVAVLAVLSIGVAILGGSLSILTLGISFWWMSSLKRRKLPAKV
jgi:hypothetical protein